MSQTTLQRNIEIMLAVANGADHTVLAEKHHFASRANVGSCVREGMAMLKRYSGEDIPETSSYEIIHPMRERLAELAKKTKMPKVAISHRVHMYLTEHYGFNYPKKAKKVAQEWDEVTDKKLSRWHHRSERECVKKWLASEKHYVDNYVGDEELNIVQNAIKEALEKHPPKDVGFSFEKSDYDRYGVIRFTLKTGKDTESTRRLKLGLL